jgi:hypothetical protein
MKSAATLILSLLALSAFGPAAFAKRSLVQEVSLTRAINKLILVLCGQFFFNPDLVSATSKSKEYFVRRRNLWVDFLTFFLTINCSAPLARWQVQVPKLKAQSPPLSVRRLQIALEIPLRIVPARRRLLRPPKRFRRR